MKTRILSKICGLMLFMPLLTFAQHSIKGVVKGNDGNPIPGVKVEIQKPSLRRLPTQNGEFFLQK